mmetsp:Transcript_6213/g.10293  ORF Transcript_6213/g.10293 Transcript_6213/m.10293 type:complete len:220 (-) Transcript_6213:50-709(-)
MSSSGIGAAISSITTSLTDAQTQTNGTRRRRQLHLVEREDQRQIPMMTEEVSSEDFHIFMGSSVMHKVYDHALPGPDPYRIVPLQHAQAAGVAIAKKALGKGSERFAYQFFEIAQDGKTVVGEPLVAKASKFVESLQDTEDHKKFLRRFCQMHDQVSKVATIFNQKLDSVVKFDTKTARVSCLSCSVYRALGRTRKAVWGSIWGVYLLRQFLSDFGHWT